MRPLEAGVHALTIAACVASLATTGDASVTTSATLTGAALLALALQRWSEGYRWQLWGAHLAAGCQAVVLSMVVLQATAQPASPAAPAAAIKYTFAAVLFICSLASAGLCWLFPVFRFPAPTGPFQVACHDLELADAERLAWTEPWDFDRAEPRRMFARIWYPTSIVAADSGGGSGGDRGSKDGQRQQSAGASAALPGAAAAEAAARAQAQRLIKRATYYAFVHHRGPSYTKDFKMPSYLLSHFVHLTSNAWVPSAACHTADSSPGQPQPPPLPVDSWQERYPLVVFSHGFTGSFDQSTALCENLASQGYVVAAFDHSYCSLHSYHPRANLHLRYNARAPPEVAKSPEALYLLRNQHLQVRVQDVLSVIKLLGQLGQGELASEPACVNAAFKGRLDLGSIGLMGHSFGGATVLQAADQHPAVKAVLSLDAWTFALDRAIQQEGIRRPFITIQTSQFYDQSSVWGAANDQQVEQIVAASKVAQGAGAARLARIRGAAHFDFTDLPFWAPLVTTRLLKFTSVPGEAMYSILGQYAGALFGRHIKGEAGAAGKELLEGRRLLEGVTFE